METTHTMAGLLADAGAARFRVAAPLASCSTGVAVAAPYGVTAQHPVSGTHQTTSWISGALVTPTTFMVLDRKNRPTRPLSELSP
jgi:hypothetical protein